MRDWGLKRCTACGIGSLRGSIASLAAIGAAIRLASAPIIRCRSADLVLVQPNHRLPIVRILRRAPAMPPWQAMASLYKSEVVGNCVRVTNRRQSDSENRSRPNRIEELNAALPRAGILIPEAQRPFEPETANLKPFSRGIKRGILSFVKESIPLLFAPPCLQGTLFLHRMWKSLTPWCGRTKQRPGGSARCRWRTLSHSAYPGARCG